MRHPPSSLVVSAAWMKELMVVINPIHNDQCLLLDRNFKTVLAKCMTFWHDLPHSDTVESFLV